MRISDWSSDVCSSDLADLETAAPLADRHHLARSIGKGHDPARSATAIEAVRDQQVTIVERHRLERDEQLARPRLRRRAVDEREAVDAVPRRNPVTAHLSPPLDRKSTRLNSSH